MPTLTYLGIDVLRLPFIRDTSLGHEVLHNWWGNGVYPDYATGNWSEGLTTFMADHAYREQAGPEAARELRLGWLRDLAALDTGQDRPLREFTSRTHGSDQVVGYHKSAMLFLMLRDTIGAEAFDQGVRAFWARASGIDRFVGGSARRVRTNVAARPQRILHAVADPLGRAEPAPRVGDGSPETPTSGAWTSRSARTGRPTHCACQ